MLFYINEYVNWLWYFKIWILYYLKSERVTPLQLRILCAFKAIFVTSWYLFRNFNWIICSVLLLGCIWLHNHKIFYLVLALLLLILCQLKLYLYFFLVYFYKTSLHSSNFLSVSQISSLLQIKHLHRTFIKVSLLRKSYFFLQIIY